MHKNNKIDTDIHSSHAKLIQISIQNYCAIRIDNTYYQYTAHLCVAYILVL